jgi:signal transduction histidine kinase
MRNRARSVWIGCILAIAVTGAIALFRSALESWLPKDAPLLIFVATTTIAAWYGGLLPGLLATALGAFAEAFYFARPAGSLWIQSSNERVWLAAFVVVGVMISFVCEALHAARRRAERSAREALESRRRLEEADRRKNEFLAVLAHELRNPLAAITSATSLMRMNDVEEDILEECSDVIGRQTGQLSRMVDDLLDISRISRGKVELQTKPLQLSDVVDRAVESSLPMIEAHAHRLEVSLPHEPVRIEGDLIRLTQVVTNLLNNAAKYTPDGGCIAVSVSTDNNDAVVRVQDSGIGLPADLLPGIFNVFMQVEESRKRSEGGLGIGLSLVRQLVEMHGGTVEAFSEGPGRGSEFVVRLRLLPGDPRQLPAQELAQAASAQ